MLVRDLTSITPRETVEILRLILLETDPKKLRLLLREASAECSLDDANGLSCRDCPLCDMADPRACFIRRYVDHLENISCELSFIMKRERKLLKKIFLAEVEYCIAKWDATPNRILYELG